VPCTAAERGMQNQLVSSSFQSLSPVL
jgi:hypothetical protein